MKHSKPNVQKLWKFSKIALNLRRNNNTSFGSRLNGGVPLEPNPIILVAKVGSQGQKWRKMRAKRLDRLHHPDRTKYIQPCLDQDHISIFIIICRQRRTHLNAGQPPVLQPAAQPQPPPGKESHQTPGSCPGSFKHKKKDATATSLGT